MLSVRDAGDIYNVDNLLVFLNGKGIELVRIFAVILGYCGAKALKHH